MDRLLVICPSGYFVAAVAAGFDLRAKRLGSRRARGCSFAGWVPSSLKGVPATDDMDMKKALLMLGTSF
jgi:hypothetical protein